MALLPQPKDNPQCFDAIVVVDPATAGKRVVGLTVEERARRVARRSGAQNVHSLVLGSDADATRARIEDLELASDKALLVIWSRDHLVHTPLVASLTAVPRQRAIVVDGDGGFAGAALASPQHRTELVMAIAERQTPWPDVARACGPDADADADRVCTVEHGELARHVVRTAQERRQAARWLTQIIHKAQDGPVTRWLYRPVSLLVTRMLLWTPITPNQVSVLVGIIGAIGVYMTAHFSYDMVTLGSALVLIASYLDGCDGEIARFRVQSSRFGAWLDTIIDELTTIAYTAALGYHVYLRADEPWVIASIAYVMVVYLMTLYSVYYYLIVVHGTANSQDYVDRLEVVTHDDGQVYLQPQTQHALSGIWAVLPHLARRDFLSWLSLGLAAASLTSWLYVLFVVGGTVSAYKTFAVDHRRLRGQLRELRQRRAQR